jgi:scyllo-inositol 2-dehydrogenase (NADP+)
MNPCPHQAVIVPNIYHLVLVDKPVTPTFAEATELARIAQREHRTLLSFQNRRLDGDFLTVKKLIEEKIMGDVYEFESQ